VAEDFWSVKPLTPGRSSGRMGGSIQGTCSGSGTPSMSRSGPRSTPQLRVVVRGRVCPAGPAPARRSPRPAVQRQRLRPPSGARPPVGAARASMFSARAPSCA